MKKSLEQARNFANFCMNNALNPEDVAELIQAADLAFSWGERNSNATDEHTATNATRKEQKYGQKVGEIAKRMGLEVSWSGLWPTVTKGGKEIHLPQIG